MGAATLRRNEPILLLPRALPSVTGAEHQRALTDLRREMGIEVLAAKKAGGYTQAELDAAVSEAVKKAVNEALAAKPVAAPEPDSVPEAAAEPHHSQDMNANDAIEYLEGIDNVADAEAMKVAEAGGRQRKGVLKAIDKHLEWLKE